MTKSPDVSIRDANACAIQSNGKLGKYEYIDNSYGSPMTAVNIVTYGAWDVWTSGAVDFYNGYAFNSYGKSPITGESMGALQVWANGMTLENYRNMVAGSYGNRRTLEVSKNMMQFV